jgi:hypothetical protein
MSIQTSESTEPQSSSRVADEAVSSARPSPAGKSASKEIGGRDGLEPTRYGDWDKNGRCVDF